jgi:hypothetical protein
MFDIGGFINCCGAIEVNVNADAIASIPKHKNLSSGCPTSII